MKIICLLLLIIFSDEPIDCKVDKNVLDTKINKTKYTLQEIVQFDDTLKFVQYTLPNGDSYGFGIHGSLKFAKEKEINDSMEVWLEKYKK